MTREEEADAAAIVEGCLAGDDRARATFIATYSDLIEWTVRRTIPRHAARHAEEEIRDLHHEILLQIFDNECAVLKQVRDARAIRGWLLTVARNHTITYLRREARFRESRTIAVRESPAPAHTSPEASASKNEEVQRVQREIALLPARDRFLIHCYYGEDRTYAEIASMLGISINTVASALRRARLKLRRELEEDSDE